MHTSNTEQNKDLRAKILKAGHARMAKVTMSQNMYSNNTVSPIETKNQEIVEIGIDDLMELVEQAVEEAQLKALEPVKRWVDNYDENKTFASLKQLVYFQEQTILHELAQLSTNSRKESSHA